MYVSGKETLQVLSPQSCYRLCTCEKGHPGLTIRNSIPCPHLIGESSQGLTFSTFTRLAGKYLTWHINGLDLRAVHLALTHFLPFLTHSHVIVRTDNMAVVSHINRQGGSRPRTLNRHARQLLLWAQDKF